jgi:hypothetical protein
MKARRTIQNQLRAIQRNRRKLGNGREDDQAYGAAEALRWILGDAPPPVGLAQPFGEPARVLFGWRSTSRVVNKPRGTR